MKSKAWRAVLLTVNQLKAWLHKKLTNTEKLLIILASMDKPCAIQQIKDRSQEGGFKIPAKWNPSLILGRSKGLAIKTPAGWEITDEGRQYLGKLGVQKISLPEASEVNDFNLEDLLHPVIREASLKQYRNEHYREAVLNGTLGLGDFIRKITGFTEDGDALVTKTFSPNNPKLILSEVTTLSGQNDQKGFMLVMQGVMTGIRNPKAHSLITDISKLEAAQYLIFLSLLARRIDESKVKS